ncbi:Uncharacterised protein [Pseudescherichia vulneris]|nr:Uncharacterised protein [Pseudescherichia vulneris]
MASPLQVDSARLWQTLNEFATLGATAGGRGDPAGAER